MPRSIPRTMRSVIAIVCTVVCFCFTPFARAGSFAAEPTWEFSSQGSSPSAWEVPRPFSAQPMRELASTKSPLYVGMEFRWGAGRIERYLHVRRSNPLQSSGPMIGVSLNMNHHQWWNPAQWSWKTRLLAVAVVGGVVLAASRSGGSDCGGQWATIPSSEDCEESFELACDARFDDVRLSHAPTSICIEH